MRRKILLGLLILFIILSIVVFHNIYLKNITLKNLSSEIPVIFSARMYNGESGTFSYDISENKIDKISEHVFNSLSYDRDKKRIIGFVWDNQFKGMAELKVESKTFFPLLSLEELKDSVERLGLQLSPYSENNHNFIVDMESSFIKPKYYKEGYTFIFNGVVYLFYKEQNEWSIKPISNIEHNVYDYFIDDKGELFLETTREVLRDNINSGKLAVLLERENDYAFGYYDLMDMSEDINSILYFGKRDIFFYDIKMQKKRHMINHISVYERILNLRLSKNGRYIFYTTGEPGFFGGLDRYVFYIVDTKTKVRVQLKSGNDGNIFCGFDW